MQRSIRASTPADAGAITELLSQSGLRPNLAPEHLYWKYWRPRTDWTAPRSYVLVDGTTLVAHAALIPTACMFAERREPIVHMIDWAARPDEGGSGVALMKHVLRHAGSLLAVGGSQDTLRILPYVGFQPFGKATAYVRPLFPLRMLHGTPSLRLLARVARGMVWKASALAPARRGDKWSAYPLRAAERARLQAVLPAASTAMTVLYRASPLFDYLVECPILRMVVYGVECAQRLRGYFVLAFAPGQVRIVDCWADSAEAGDWRSLVLGAVGEAMCDPQAAEVVVCASDPLLEEAVRACGFHARYTVPVHVRLQQGATAPIAPLRVQMLDSDAAFLHSSEREFWA